MNKLKCAGVAVFGLLFSFVITLNRSLAEDCQLQQYASIPIMLDAKDHIFLPASLNGTEFQFTLAIGSPVSSIFRSATNELQLKPAPASGVVQYNIRGETSGSKITVEEMKLGNLAIHNVVFLVLEAGDPGKSGDGYYQETIGGKRIGGHLSLANYDKLDVEIDLNSGKFNIFSPDHCDGSGLYWASRGVVLDIDEKWSSAIDFSATLDGRELPSRLFTSTPRTTISWQHAREMGISQDSPGVTQITASETDREDALSDYVLHTLQIGGEKLSNFPVRIRKFRMTSFSTNGSGFNHFDANVDVLIGVDFLMLNRVYVARREHKMYFTPYTAEEKKAILERRVSN